MISEDLSVECIRANLLPSLRAALDIAVVSETTSTNDAVIAQRVRHEQTCVCFAEYLSAARGQHGRPWVTRRGHNIYSSVLSFFPQPPSALLGLSLAVAVAVIRALTAYGIASGLQLKWPNDIYWNGRKLAGILIESVPQKAGCDVIVGIGINGWLPAAEWIDLYTITKQPVRRNELAGLLLNALIPILSQFQQTGLAPFLAEWKRYDFLIGKQVTLHTATHAVHRGLLQNITDTGALLLQKEDGTIQTCLSGEVSLRWEPGTL